MKELNLKSFLRILALVLFFEISLFTGVLAQCQALGPPAPTYNCEDVVVGVPPGKSGFFMNTPGNLEVVFDSYSDYSGSVVLSGATQLAITAEQLAASLPAQCKWELQMVVDNSTFGLPAAPVVAPAANEWFPDVIYGLGSSGPYPQIYELEVRINNACGTPISTVYQNFTNDFDAITIIDGTVLQAAGACASGVNGQVPF